MKHILLQIVIVFVVATSAHSQSLKLEKFAPLTTAERENQTVQLKVNEEVSIDEGKLVIHLVRVMEATDAPLSLDMVAPPIPAYHRRKLFISVRDSGSLRGARRPGRVESG